MNEPTEPCLVVAIGGPSGAGKSTALRNTAAKLSNAVEIYFDDYESVSTYPEMSRWLAEGGDPNQFRTPRLSQDLRALRNSTAITLPHNGALVRPAPVILLEEPFGRERAEMEGLIDMVVCIDLPLEIALARKLMRMLEFYLAERSADAFAQQMRFFLPWYIDSGRALYGAVQQRVLQRCDLVVDGLLPPDALADRIAGAISQRSR
jgi:uridine kinase